MEKSRSFPSSSSSSSYNRFGLLEEEPSSSKAYSFNGPPCNKAAHIRLRCSSNPESRRKKRVASYNAFVMEAKLKTSVRNSFKWIKTKFIGIW
ncbi:hypothetical protein Sjap_010576 [Stephania japonica]|uniref:Uncharacterized protein n=1 Tax=Stephania japonica TaxID=461633 RepID=A0AAP0P4Q3_9MAGN